MLRSLILLLALLWSFVSFASDKDSALIFDLEVNPQFSKYQNIFLKPSFAVMALQNSGFLLSSTMPIEFISPQQFKMGSSILEFKSVNNDIYHYFASLNMPLGVTNKTIYVPIDIDTRQLRQGRIKLIVNSPFMKIIPDNLLIRLDSKIKILSGLDSQKALISYFESDEISHRGKDLNGIDERIAVDYIRQILKSPSHKNKDLGASEPINDQLALILSVIIWLAGLPLFLILARKHRLKVLGKHTKNKT
jgi:hypothetical protein